MCGNDFALSYTVVIAESDSALGCSILYFQKDFLTETLGCVSQRRVKLGTALEKCTRGDVFFLKKCGAAL